MLLFLLFIIGICVGSFLNVLADRLPNNEQILKGRSHCDHCKKTLNWYDMIPLLSFLALRGRCRYCKTHFSYYYPIVEAVAGILFVATYLFTIYNLPFTIESATVEQLSRLAINYFFYLFIVCSLIVIFFADLKYGIIPDAVLFPTTGAVIIYYLLFTIHDPAIINHQSSIINYFLSGVGSFLFFLFLFLVTRGRGMGFGDVKLSFMMGILLGFPGVIFSFYIAFLTGAVAGIILIVWGKKKLSAGTIPFGPFMVLGTLSVLFFGQQISRLVLPLLSF